VRRGTRKALNILSDKESASAARWPAECPRSPVQGAVRKHVRSHPNKEQPAMGHQFSLILDREITEQESVTLKETSSANIFFASAALPTNADVPVTRVTFDDDVTPTLAEAIEAGFEAVKTIPGLAIPGLSVPAQPAVAEADQDEVATEDKTEAHS
jgi:hypothetical protein